MYVHKNKINAWRFKIFRFSLLDPWKVGLSIFVRKLLVYLGVVSFSTLIAPYINKDNGVPVPLLPLYYHNGAKLATHSPLFI